MKHPTRDELLLEPLMSPADLATYLNVPLETTRRWRVHGVGPRGAKVGRHVRYMPADVLAWVQEQSDAA